MVTKMLIQVISVVTLVFGTCYQSVQALASNTKRIEIQSARLIDEDNTAPATVKAGSEHELVVNLTINNKDGDHESGTAQLWVPEEQLTLLEKKATFEPVASADNARLVYEKLANNQLQLSWQKVANTATFKVELSVRVNQAMTEMRLPIAVGSTTDYLQPLTVLTEDATDDAVAEITGDSGLPGNILANLDQYLTAQQAQEEAQAAAAKQEADAAAQKKAEEQAKADAAAKAEAEAAEKKAAEDKAKQEAEAKKQAEKDAAAKKEKKQQEADEAKEAAKAKATLKARSAKVTEASKDGEERESKDAKLNTTGKNIAEYLKNDDGPATSFFNRIQLTDTDTNETINVGNGDEINVSDQANFTLHYEWDTNTIRNLIKSKHKLAVNDYYTFKITGLKIENEVTSKDILDKNSGDVLGQYSIKETGENEYTVTVKFTSDKIEITKVNYVMDIEQVTIPGDDIEFEYNDGAIWTAKPVEEKSLLEKSGQFIGNQEIRWTVKMVTSEAKVGKKIQFSDIALTDKLQTNNHKLDQDNLQFTAHYANDGDDVSDYFTPEVKGNELTIKGTKDIVVDDDLVFTFVTTYEGSSNAKYENTVKGKIGDNLNLKEVIAATQQNALRKSYAGYNDADGTYAWKINTTLRLSQYSDAQIDELLKGLVITDTAEGAHQFNGSKLALKMTIGGKDVDYEDWFNVTPESGVKANQMTIDVRDDADISTLREKLIVDGKDQEISLTYKTEKDGKGNIANVKNKVSLKFDGESQTGNAGSGDKYITKTGELDYKYDEENATINWTITVNPKKYAFTELEVVDVLPERITADIEAVIISKDADGNDVEEKVSFKEGYVEGYSANRDTFYKFVEGTSATERRAIQFNFDNSYSGKEIKIKLTTQHAWDDLGENYTYKNEAGARFDNNWFGFADGSVTVQKDIGDNVYKHGKLQLADTNANPENDNNQVEWEVGFGSQLRTTFGHGTGQTNDVQIRDWLNANDLPYLSFPDDEAAYQLYEITHSGGNNNYTFNRSETPIDKREYHLVIKNDPESETGKIITIQFTDEAKAKGYQHLSLVFSTPIDLMAWQQKESQKEVPERYDFHNSAVVTYGGKEYGKVSDTVGFSSDNVYGKKTVEQAEGGQINWQVLLNALGKNIGKPTITDKVGAGHVHSANLDEIELSMVDVSYTADGTNGFDFTVNKDNQDVLERNKDYTVDVTDDVMTIQLKVEVNRPLQLRYKTVVKDYQLGSYKNNVNLTGKGYSPTFSATATVTASAWADSFLAAFTKVDGATDKPLAGAKFKLQWDRDGTGVWTDAQNIDGEKYDIVTSNELGQIQFELLGDVPTYRLIEVATPAGYESSQMAPIEFDKDAYDELKGHRPVIKNWDVKKADLVISKSVKNLNQQRFEFEIEAVTVEKSNVEGIEDTVTTDTEFNGTYKLENGNEVTFENGVSTKISVASDDKVTLKHLPVYKATENGKGDKWQFIVREVSASDNYNTLVWLNDEEPLAGKETAPFELDENQSNSVMAFFKNTADTGNLRLNKLVISDTPKYEKDDFVFTITATEGLASIAGKTFEATGRYTEVDFNDEGVATVKLKHNETVEILGLPAATKFKVEEDHHNNLTADWSIDNGDYEEDTIPEVTIAADKTTLLTYRNSDVPTGQIRLEKLILGDVKAEQDFMFTVTPDTPITDGQYVVSVFKVGDNQPVRVTTANFEDGEIEVKLRGNQYAMISGLPLEPKYTVSETDPNTGEVKGIKTTWETNDDSGDTLTTGEITLENKNVVEPVTFTNALPNGDLKLNKKVLSNYPIDSEKAFEFTIEAKTDGDAERLKGKVYQVENHDLTYLTFDANGQAKLTLKHNQSALIKGLPVGVQVRITEKADANFSATYQVGDGDKEDQDGDGPTVTISDEKTEVVKYENSRHPDGSLHIEKIGENLTTKQDFKFKIEAKDDQQLTGVYDGVLKQRGDNEETDHEVTFTDGEAIIKLKAGEYLVVQGLPLGDYVVSEKATDGLTTSWTVTGQEASNAGETDAVDGYYQAAPAKVTEKTTPKVVYTNSLMTGKLQVNKHVASHLDKDLNATYTFDLAVNDDADRVNGNTYKVTGNDKQPDLTFEDGKAVLKIQGSGSVVVDGLPTGIVVSVKERVEDDGLEASWLVGIDGDYNVLADDNYPEVEIQADKDGVVSYKNTRELVGSLTLNKWVASQHEDDLKSEYKFTLTASDDDIVKVADKKYEVKGHDETTHVTFDENGKAELTMIHNVPVTINGLPVGVELTVTETTIKDFVATWRVNNTGDYVALTDDAQPTITIDDTHMQVVSYKNTRDPEGQLQIEKQVTGAVADEDARYNFVIEAIDTTTGETTPGDGDTTEQPTETETGDATEQPVGDETSTDTEPTPETVTPEGHNLLDLNGSYSVLVYQSGTDKLLHKDTVEFDKGQATLTLKADQYAVVNGLPLHTYQVREVDPEVANMSTTWSLNGGQLTAGLQADAHELTADGVMTVLFNNAVSTGDLSIEKQVTGAVTEADEQQAYDFAVTAYRVADDGKVEVDTDYNQQHAATLTATNGAETTIRLDFKKGELAVSLKAGERLTIHNLDENRVVTVTETPLADFITTHRIGTGSVTAGNETRQIKIGDDVTKHVTFINDKPATPEVAWLSLTKSVLGSVGETDRGFDFTVQLVDHLQQPITGIVKVVKTTATGTYVSGEMLFDDHGTATVTLQHNETVKLEVPNGAHYQIAETDYSADGYVTTTSQGGNPERTGLTVTGIAHQVDLSTALVVYYNRADTTDPDDELAHTDTEDDQTMPELVGPVTDDGSSTGTTDATPQAHTGTDGTGTSGTVAPQAYTSGSSKGILPQTGEFLRNHWVAVLGWLLLMVLIGMMVWRYRLNKNHH